MRLSWVGLFKNFLNCKEDCILNGRRGKMIGVVILCEHLLGKSKENGSVEREEVWERILWNIL